MPDTYVAAPFQPFGFSGRRMPAGIPPALSVSVTKQSPGTRTRRMPDTYVAAPFQPLRFSSRRLSAGLPPALSMARPAAAAGSCHFRLTPALGAAWQPARICDGASLRLPPAPSFDSSRRGRLSSLRRARALWGPRPWVELDILQLAVTLLSLETRFCY